MGLLFLVLFIVLEIALVVLSFTKCSDKAKFLKNRVFVTVSEFALLLLIVLLPTTYMKWRFTFALVVFAVRMVISGVSYLVKHKKVQGDIIKAGRVVCSIAVVILMAFSMIPSFVFTNYNRLETTGEYEIKECNAILVDNNRVDEFENDGSNCEVPVHFYYPDTDGEFPLVVFSHGAFGYYQSNYSTYAELASNGYESYSTSWLDFLGFGDYFVPESMKDKFISLATVYVPLDGINEKGLCVADLINGDNECTSQNTDKVDLISTSSDSLKNHSSFLSRTDNS